MATTKVQLVDDITGDVLYPETSGDQVKMASGKDAEEEISDVKEEVSQLGQEVIYDVSANNGGATFASLSALLSDENLSTLIPVAVRCGGMSIRFVQSSDNKYVQWRYKGTVVTGTPNPFLDTAIWQGVDEEIVAGSDNLAKSGAVNKSIIKITGNIIAYKNRCYDQNGEIKPYASWYCTDKIDIEQIFDDVIRLSSAAIGNSGANISSVVYYNSSGVMISNAYNNVSSINKSSLPAGTKYVAFSFYNVQTATVSSYAYDARLKQLLGFCTENTEDISDINDEIGYKDVVESTVSTGSGTQYLLKNKAVNNSILYIKISGTAKFSGAMYYSFKYSDNTYTGEHTIAINTWVKFDAGAKRFVDLNIYAPQASISEAGTAIVTILSNGIKRDITLIEEDIFQINDEIDSIEEQIADNSNAECWPSDNMWDANHLFKGYLASNSSTGTPIGNDEWRMTDYLIPVIPGTKVYLFAIGGTSGVTFYVAEYDSSKNFIQRDSALSQSIYTVADGVYYIKISTYKGWAGNDFSVYAIRAWRERYLVGDYNPPFGVYENLKRGIKLQGKKVAVFGDSIIGFGNICRYLKMMTGAAEVYNVGFGGCRMAHHDANYGKFSMYKLADAIVSGDFSEQIAALPNTSLGLNGTLSLDNLTTIDWTTIDIILVHYGTNDWASGAINIGVGDIADTYDFKGMMEKSIQTILSAYPQIRIVFDTITWRDVTNVPEVTGTDFLTATNSKGNTPAEFNTAIEDVCKKYYLQSNNLTIGLFNSYNKNIYLQDSTHPNDKGWRLMAEKIASMI